MVPDQSNRAPVGADGAPGTAPVRLPLQGTWQSFQDVVRIQRVLSNSRALTVNAP